MTKKCTILMLTSIDPSWAEQDGVIDRFVYLGTQDDIDKELKTQIIEWAEDFFDLTEEQADDFNDDPFDGIQNSDYTGDYRVLIENDCTFTDLTAKSSTAAGGTNE